MPKCGKCRDNFKMHFSERYIPWNLTICFTVNNITCFNNKASWKVAKWTEKLAIYDWNVPKINQKEILLVSELRGRLCDSPNISFLQFNEWKVYLFSSTNLDSSKIIQRKGFWKQTAHQKVVQYFNFWPFFSNYLAVTDALYFDIASY